MTEGKLEIIPLGGIGHFGMNMMVMRYGDEAIVISYCDMEFETAKHFAPWVIFPDYKGDNQIKK